MVDVSMILVLSAGMTSPTPRFFRLPQLPRPTRRVGRAGVAAAVLLATAAGGLAIANGYAASAATAVTGQITGLNGACIGLAGGATANRTRVDAYSCVGSTTQRWTLPGDGTIRNSGKCLDVAAAGTANGTIVQIYRCNGTAAQQWLASAGHALINPRSGKCLDLTGNTSADQTPVQLWTCTGGANQQWLLPGGQAGPSVPASPPATATAGPI